MSILLLWQTFKRVMDKKLAWGIVALVFNTLFLSVGSILTPAYASAATQSATPTYVDATLHFGLQLPSGWVATPHPGKLSTSNTAVTFTNPQLPKTNLQIGVMRSPTAATDFARRGKPTLSIGGYPAFKLDVSAAQTQSKIPCLVRIMLVNSDTVIASWCASDASVHTQQFAGILATYTDHNATPQGSPVNSVQSCSQVMSSGENSWGSFPSGDATFGAQRVSPNDSTWTNSFGEGVAVCNDYYASGGYMWENSYLFQCVELANRFINEEWGLAGFNVDAYAYFNYYDGNGNFQEGAALTTFQNQVQLSDDAAQTASTGTSSFAPSPGDLLIFQDVNNGSDWRSGQIAGDPGHVVVITNVASDHVDVVQQNWHNGETHSFPMSKVGNSYHITDNSGWTGRITRGWIHFSANSHSSGGTPTSPPSSPPTTHPSSVVVKYANGAQDLIAVGKDGRMWHNWADASGNWTGWNWWSNGTDFANVTPTLVKYAGGAQDLIAVGKDGRMWRNWTDAAGNWIGWNWWGNASFTNVAPTLINYGNGSMDLIEIGMDGRMWHNWADASGNWIGWNWWSSGTDFASVTPTLVKYNDGSMDLIAVGKTSILWHNWTSASGSWIGWNWWGNASNFANVTPTVIKYADGSQDLIAVTTDGHMWHNWTSASGSWIGWNWFSSGTGAGFTDASPTLVQYASGVYDLIEVGMDGRMWHNWTSASGSWIGWNWFSNNTAFAS